SSFTALITNHQSPSPASGNTSRLHPRLSETAPKTTSPRPASRRRRRARLGSAERKRSPERTKGVLCGRSRGATPRTLRASDLERRDRSRPAPSGFPRTSREDLRDGPERSRRTSRFFPPMLLGQLDENTVP